MHLRRDNPNVPSDLEQMPHLLNFLKHNGTFNTNDHTILISHTGGGILSTLTGLYPDRHGQAVSNSYGYFRPALGVGFSSSFKYWTDNTDGGNPANNPPTPSADPNYNMVNADPASLGGTGAARNAPAPWVPFTRAGCDVGNVGVANTVLENNTAIILRDAGAHDARRRRPRGRDEHQGRAASRAWPPARTSSSRTGRPTSELATIANVGTAGSGGTGVNLTAPLAKAHAERRPFTVYATDPTGDMTRVFGEGSPEWVEGRNSQIARSGTAARNLAQTDFVGYRDPLRDAGGGICAGNTNARAGPAARRGRRLHAATRRSSAPSTSTRRSRAAAPSVNGIDGQPDHRSVQPAGLPGLRRHVPEATRWARSRRCRSPGSP